MSEEIKIKGLWQLALSYIPLALACGASAWIGVWITLHNENRQLNQEDRMATYVGAAERPKEKVVIAEGPSDCVALTRAEFDGEKILMYAENRCSRPIDYLAWHWQALSPDGTAIAQGYTNLCPIPLSRGQKSECKDDVNVHSDDRVAKVIIWLKTNVY